MMHSSLQSGQSSHECPDAELRQKLDLAAREVEKYDFGCPGYVPDIFVVTCLTKIVHAVIQIALGLW